MAYAYSLRIWLTGRKSKASFVLNDKGFRIGSEVKAKIEKSRFGTAGRLCNFKILWGDDVGVQDEESWLDAVKGSKHIEQSGAWFTLTYEDGTTEKFQAGRWMEKMGNEKFKARIAQIMDEEVITKFSEMTGDAADFYDTEEEEWFTSDAGFVLTGAGNKYVFNEGYSLCIPGTDKCMGFELKAGAEWLILNTLSADNWDGTINKLTGELALHPDLIVSVGFDVLVASLEATAYGGLDFVVALPDDYVKRACINMGVTVKGHIFGIGSGEKKFRWNTWCPVENAGMAACAAASGHDLESVLSLGDEGGPGPIDRDYLNGDYAIWLPAAPGDGPGRPAQALTSNDHSSAVVVSRI